MDDRLTAGMRSSTLECPLGIGLRAVSTTVTSLCLISAVLSGHIAGGIGVAPRKGSDVAVIAVT